MDILKYFVDNSYTPIMSVIIAIIYVLGFVFILKCFLQLKHLADFKNMMAGRTEVTKAITMFIVGLILLYTPSILQILATSIWVGEASNPAKGTTYAGIMSNIAVVAKILGLIGFVRGWIMLAHGNQAQQQGPSKAIVHIIGGFLLYHINDTVSLLKSIFGL
jgi:hypothetical protein